jgi:hypothetical protein
MADLVVGQDADRVAQAVPAARHQDRSQKSLRSKCENKSFAQ